MGKKDLAEELAWIAWSMLNHDSDPESDPWAVEMYALLVSKFRSRLKHHRTDPVHA